MAKKEKFELDDFGFDDELNFDDPDFSSMEVKDDRKPATKIKDGFIGGVRDTATSPEFIRRMVKESLPRGYGSAMDLADQTAGSLKNLYNTSAKELKPVINELRRTTKRVMPMADKYLPRKVAERIKKWSDKDDAKGMSQDDQREASLQMQLGDIFKYQAEEAAKDKQESDVKDKLREGIEQSRHRSQMSQFDVMRTSLQRLVDYQDKVTVNYQRKSLELQLRQYFIAQDMLEEHKKFAAVSQTNLENIVKNTGLPDFQKIKYSESFAEIARNKFIEALQDGIFDKRRNFVRNVGAKIGQAVKDKVSSFASDVSSGLGAADMMLDQHEAMQEAGMGGGFSAAEIGGNMAGSAAVDSVGKRLGRFLRKKADQHEGVVRTGNNLLYGTENLPQIANEWAMGNTEPTSKLGKFFSAITPNSLQDFLKDIVRDELSGPDTTTNLDKAGNLQDPFAYTRQANKSVTEIIPGFLARIYQELQILRTGDTNIELTTYDYTANKFSQRSKAFKNAFNSIFNKHEQANNKDDINNLIKKVESETGTNLSGEQRKALGEFLLKQNLSHREASPERLKSYDTYAMSGTQAGRYGAEFSEMFENYFREDSLNNKRRDFAKEFGQLGSGISDGRASIQSLINLGMLDFVRDAGLVDERGNIDMDKLYKYYYEDQYDPEAGTVAQGQGGAGLNQGGGRRRNRRRSGTPRPQPATATQGAAPDFTFLQDSNKELLSAVQKGNRESLDFAEANNVKPVADTISETLLRIEQRLNAGLLTIDGTELMENPNRGGAQRWWNKTFKQGAKDTWQFGTDTARKGWGRLMKFKDDTKDRVMGWGTKAKNFGENVLGMGREKLEKAKDKMRELNDIYVKGELEPRLAAWKLKAGKYFVRDESGKLVVITSIKQIAGDVYDEAGNRVMSAKEAAQAYMKQGKMEKLLSALGAAKKTLTEGFLGLKSTTTQRLTSMMQFGRSMVKQALNMSIFRAEDVYVKGKKEPVLLAVTMKAGYYHSKNDISKTIRHPGDIDGPVVNNDGDVVLTEEDLKAGLLDKNGKTLRTGWHKVSGFLSDTAKKGWAMLNKGWGKVKGAAKWAKDKLLNGVDWFKNFAMPDGIAFAGGKTIIERLTEIRDILQAKFGKAKKLLGDLDGDGDVDNSFKDQREKQKEKDKERAEKIEKIKQEAKDRAAKALEKGKEWGQKGKGLLGSAWDKGKSLLGFGDDDEDDSGIDVDIDLDGDNHRDRKRRRRAARRRLAGRKGRGLWGKAKNLGGRALGGIGRGAKGVMGGLSGGLGKGLLSTAGKTLGLAGTAYGAYSAYDNLKQGNYGAAAVDTGLAAGGLAMTGGGLAGVGAMGSGIMSGIGAAATGAAGILGSIVASPALLIGAAIAAVGAAGYFGYKYWKKRNASALSKLRYVQYGFAPDDTSHMGDIADLEEALKPGVISDGGRPAIDDKKVDLKKVVSIFGIDPEDKGQQKRFEAWAQWFSMRFKPVFLNHFMALKSMQKTLGDIDDLKPEEKKQYFNLVKGKLGAYEVMVSPFSESEKLVATSEVVSQHIKTVEEELAKEDKKKDDKATETGLGTAATATGAAALLATNENTSPSEMMTMFEGDKPPPANADNLGLGALTGPSAMTTVSGTFGGFSRTNTGRLDALTCVRYKTYGLSEMVMEKVRALDEVEAMVTKSLTFDGKGVASWQGNMEKVLSVTGPSFGIDGVNNDDAYEWRRWFRGRFLPTFLNYAGALKAATGKDNIEQALTALKANQEVDVATAIYTSKEEGDGGSVWQMTASPWPGYVLNTNSSSVEPNVQALKEIAKKMVVDETIGVKDSQGKGSDNGTGISDGTSKQSMLGKAWDATKNFAASVGNAVANSTIGRAAGAVYQGAKDAIFGGSQDSGTGGTNMQAAGQAVSHPGKGTGGDINSLPMPNGPSGKWASVKDLILQAAKMVGVDEKLMATMGAIESGFNWTVKAGTSSATGLYQFIKGTWDTMLRKYGAKYGIAPGTSPTDPRANALMGAEFLKENVNALKGSVKRPLTDTDLYIAHFMGAGGAKKFLTADPNADATALMPAAARANKSIFYDPSGRPRTVGEVYAEINRRVRSRGKQFGIDDGSQSIVNGPTPAKPGETTASTATASATPASSIAGGDAGVGIPVMDQTPGVSPPAKTTTVAATSTASPSGSAASSTGPAEPKTSDFGFAPPSQPISNRAQSLQAQQQLQRDSMSETIGMVDSTLKQSLVVQQGQLEILKKIFGIMEAGGSKETKSTETPAAPSRSRTPGTAPRAPISMTKES